METRKLDNATKLLNQTGGGKGGGARRLREGVMDLDFDA